MSWSERYLRKISPERTGGEALTEPTKPPLVSFVSTGSHDPVGKKTGDAPCPACGCGSFWRGESGAWACEQCTPVGNEHVACWRNIGGGKVPPAPRPAEPWPADLNAMLNRVATAFEWTDADRQDFVAWARRSPEGLANARVFLEHEIDKLPTLIKQAGNI